MNALRYVWAFLVCGSIFASQPVVGQAQQSSDASKASAHPSTASSERDGWHDFDFELGSWKIHLKRLVHPLTGSTTWVEFDGTTVTRKVWDGRAQVEEFETVGASGPVEGLTLRAIPTRGAPVVPLLGQWQGRHPGPAHDRRIQEWSRRVLRSGTVQRPGDTGAIYLVAHHAECGAF